MKPTANIALAAALIAGMAGLGAWWGQRSAHSVAASPDNPSKIVNPHAKSAGPPIALPRALTDDPPLEEILPNAGSAASATATATAKDPDIVPGGAVAGNVVNRMWETTASQPWQVRAAPITPPNWFITGVVQRGEKTQIIVQFDGEPTPRFLKIGDVLPGGGKLAWVRPGAIGVITPKHKRIGVPVMSDSPAPAPVHSTGPNKNTSATAH